MYEEKRKTNQITKFFGIGEKGDCITSDAPVGCLLPEFG
jgi:hypothetical protein